MHGGLFLASFREQGVGRPFLAHPFCPGMHRKMVSQEWPTYAAADFARDETVAAVIRST
jgi:hypothetical protein